MKHKTVELLDLPDEILLIIMKKVGSLDVLYSLLGVNKRLDKMARSIEFTNFLDFSVGLPFDEFFPFNHSKFDRIKSDRLLHEILPQIHHNIIALTLDSFSMERVLLTCKYPNLRMIVIDNFVSFSRLRNLTGASPIIRLFRDQITYINVKIRQIPCTDKFFTDICSKILSIFPKLCYLNINQSIKCQCAKLLLRNRSSNIFYSSHLRTLIIDVASFDDCLRLLDGRLQQLSSLIVNVRVIKRHSLITNNRKIVSNLKQFSLTCHSKTIAYDDRILPLLHRMTNLNSLTLHLNISRTNIIDGIHFNENILHHMLHLNIFIFNICSIILTSQTNHFLSADDIQNRFINWKYSPVICCLDHFSNGYTYSHIYSTPFKMTRFMYLSNSFRDHHLQSVIDLTLYDTRPFEHHFFKWISQGFPLLKYLKVNNSTPQSKKCETDNKKIYSKISYLHLFQLNVYDAHIDYVNQFLNDKNAYVPSLHTLMIEYEELVTVTNNFTNDATRFNCGQLKRLISDKSRMFSEHFRLYFPSLLK